jgi:hypothetical protein
MSIEVLEELDRAISLGDDLREDLRTDAVRLGLIKSYGNLNGEPVYKPTAALVLLLSRRPRRNDEGDAPRKRSELSCESARTSSSRKGSVRLLGFGPMAIPSTGGSLDSATRNSGAKRQRF